jgi:RNA polymerase sigma-70 factor (ECF subfamily)
MLNNEGEKDKAAELFSRYGGTMLYIAESILYNKASAEDAVSGVFVKIIENFEKININDCNKTRGYIIIVTRNIALDMLKKQSRVIFLDDLAELPDEAATVFDNVSAKETCDKISKAIAGLNGNYSNILYLKLYMEYSNEEIAELLGINRTNVIIRYNRAKSALKKLLQEEMSL